jgi:hypothetical protein
MPHNIDTPLKLWSNLDLIDWAKEVYDDVVEILKEKKYKGLTLSLWETEDKFDKYILDGHGVAFYKLLLRAYLTLYVDYYSHYTEHGKISNAPPGTVCQSTFFAQSVVLSTMISLMVTCLLYLFPSTHVFLMHASE